MDIKGNMKKFQYPKEMLNRLKALYDIYDRYISTFDAACFKGCDACCTCNVTVTSLETAFLFNLLDSKAIDLAVSRMIAFGKGRRYRPEVTTNRFAWLCSRNEPVPEEENQPGWGKCPLLKNANCSIYPGRPFGCRSLVSKKVCASSGAAECSALIVTVNTVFMQIIEHLDAEGCSGNLIDMVSLNANGFDLFSGTPLIKNCTAHALMVPVEHQEMLKPMMSKINHLLTSPS